VNKPFLPVAAGELSQGAAWALCLLLAAGEGPVGVGLLCLAVGGLGSRGAKSSCAAVPVLTRIVLSGHFAWLAPPPNTCLPLILPTCLPRRRGHHVPQLWPPHHRPLLLRPLPGHHLLGAPPAPQALRHRSLHDHRHGCALRPLCPLCMLWLCKLCMLRMHCRARENEQVVVHGWLPVPPAQAALFPLSPSPHPQCAASCSTLACTTLRALRWACPLRGTPPSRERLLACAVHADANIA